MKRCVGLCEAFLRGLKIFFGLGQRCGLLVNALLGGVQIGFLLAELLLQIDDGIVLQLAGILRGLNLTEKIFLFRFQLFHLIRQAVPLADEYAQQNGGDENERGDDPD